MIKKSLNESIKETIILINEFAFVAKKSLNKAYKRQILLETFGTDDLIKIAKYVTTIMNSMANKFEKTS